MRSSSYNNGSNKQQLQAKGMRKTRSAVKFITTHNLPKTKIKLQLRQPKVAKTETVTGNNAGDQRYYIYWHCAYVERRGSCKMASFSDVNLKAL